MKTTQLLAFAFLFISFLSCKEDKDVVVEDTTPVVSTFYFIRHAEKDRSDAENANPELNQDGLGRAMLWAEVLDYENLDAIYTTDYKRTEMTAAATAVKKDMTIQYYDPRNIDIEAFKAENAGKNVLVVGHSNTTPDFVNKMLGEEKYEAMDDYDNASLFIVRLFNDTATDIRLNIHSPILE